MEATDYGQPMLEAFPLEDISVPVFDIYGSEDYPAVINGAQARWLLTEQAGNPLSKQLKIDGPDHFFEDYESVLITEVDQWLRSVRNVN